jgi:hypothetical protein
VIVVRSVLKFSLPYTPFCPYWGYSDRGRQPHYGHQPWVTGSGTPILYLTPSQAASDSAALSKIANASYSVVTRFDEGNILLQNTSTGQASLWEMNGTTQTGGGLISPNSGLGWAPVGIGDFNDDGLSDILWRNTSTGQISIGEMNGNTQIGGGLVSVNPGTAWQVVGTSDFNHDGYSDIVWQNTSSGQVSIWEMNGNTEIGGGSVSANPGAGWKVVGTGDFNHDGYSDILFGGTRAPAKSRLER